MEWLGPLAQTLFGVASAFSQRLRFQVDFVKKDTSGDGKIDVTMQDTNGDGHFNVVKTKGPQDGDTSIKETIEIDTDGTGQMDMKIVVQCVDSEEPPAS